MSSEVLEGRHTTAEPGEVTVFLIGMRINSFRHVRSWWPAMTAMRRMLRELTAEEDSGLLGHRQLLGGPRLLLAVQYWSSPEKLLAYASAADREHRPAWAAFNRRARLGRGRVGVWHETYVVPAGAHEQIYVDMPAFGLGAVRGTIPVGPRRERAAERLGHGTAR